ncbi:MAG: FHA domain-containing protein, partial [Acidobacteria bacterium]|nr:FHA domain-containing protein [Acidobacteriota bacterium]
RDGVTETVARAHARIAFDPVLAAYVVFNESSTNPTFIVRDGRSLRINPRDPRGVRLESGDHLQIGLAVLKLSIRRAGAP